MKIFLIIYSLFTTVVLICLFFHTVGLYYQIVVANDVIDGACSIAEIACEDDPRNIPESIEYLKEFMAGTASFGASAPAIDTTVREFLVKRLSTEYEEYQARKKEEFLQEDDSTRIN